ncbi:hypothetical protein ABXN37_29300, partial [Piscinibacter sakaiensis]
MADARRPVELSIEASALLTMLRREGGWWDVSRLTHHWRPTWPEAEVEQLARTLRQSGQVDVRFDRAIRARPLHPLPTGGSR